MELVPEAAPSEVDTSLSGSGAEPARPRFLPSALHELELGQDGSDDGEEDEDWEDEEGEDEDEDYEEVGAEEGAEETITWKEYIRWYTAYYLEGGVVTVLLLLASVFALYGSDLRLAYFEKEVDRAFEALSLVCLVLFLLEFLAGTGGGGGVYGQGGESDLGRFVRIVRMMRLIKFRRLARLVKYGWTMVTRQTITGILLFIVVFPFLNVDPLP
ncbi:hypothetical protein T492DRAFT_888034 [Pavlovales sp. CCMP2436]|nr:hypothetical protein T492DRAFT_888034 [Pavlovales sp. CCMP2436]